MVRVPTGVVVVGLLAGCGGSTRGGDVAGPVERHPRALSEGDFAGACRELTSEAQGEVIGLVAQAAGPRPRSCPAAYGWLTKSGSLDFTRSGVMDLSRAHRYGTWKLQIEVLTNLCGVLAGPTTTWPGLDGLVADRTPCSITAA
jgi:hypothetical protein